MSLHGRHNFARTRSERARCVSERVEGEKTWFQPWNMSIEVGSPMHEGFDVFACKAHPHYDATRFASASLLPMHRMAFFVFSQTKKLFRRFPSTLTIANERDGERSREIDRNGEGVRLID